MRWIGVIAAAALAGSSALAAEGTAWRLPVAPPANGASAQDGVRAAALDSDGFGVEVACTSETEATVRVLAPSLPAHESYAISVEIDAAPPLVVAARSEIASVLKERVTARDADAALAVAALARAMKQARISVIGDDVVEWSRDLPLSSAGDALRAVTGTCGRPGMAAAAKRSGPPSVQAAAPAARPAGCSALTVTTCEGSCAWQPAHAANGHHVRGRCVPSGQSMVERLTLPR